MRAPEARVKHLAERCRLDTRTRNGRTADKPADGSIETPAYLRPIFEGKLPYEDYINALSKVGCEYMLVEQDWCYDEDEFECLKRSFENVTSRFPNVK